MIELFADIPVEIKQQYTEIVDFVLDNLNIVQADIFLKNFINACKNEEEKEFILFLIHMKTELNKNENSND